MEGHFSHVWLFALLWTVTHQAPLSMGFSRQEYWSGLPCPPPRILRDPGIEPWSLMSPALATWFFITSATWEALNIICLLTITKFKNFPQNKLAEAWLESESKTRSVVSDSLWPHRLYSPWNSPGQNTGVGSLSLLQGIFPTQELNRVLLHCRQILYQLIC